ncbi:MAG: putative glucose-6-phosphate isomerase [Mucilaginibacter sp.]|nr:putative glucose-6-phosphate isomerase [Mucilaginibacter sp.]
MNHKNNIQSSIRNPLITFINGQLTGADVVHQVKTLIELNGIFEDQTMFEKMNGSQIAYEVDVWCPVENGTEGGLFFGLTHLYPGQVGNEYFMTKGHFHAVENRAEYYWGIEGEGILLLMDKDRNTRAERMSPGSLHYIPGFTAHRVVNTRAGMLRFGACWPADAGYNYDIIMNEGFSKRIKNIDNVPSLI